MNNKLIIAGIVGCVFCFAGYNLWSYFQEQQAIQVEQERLAEERRIQREDERRRQEEARLAAIAEQERLAEAERLAQAEKAARLQAEEDARLEAERLAREEEIRLAEERRLNDRTLKARTRRHIEGLPTETIQKLNQVSADYILANPDEFLEQTFTARMLGASPRLVKLLADDTNVLMLYAAISQDIDVIKALIDIGINIDAQNTSGYTALMFAAAYNTPNVVRFLVGQGASTDIQAHVLNLNALHTASLLNPNPDTVAVLVNIGLPLELETENGYTPLLLAVTENQNFEVAERLADLGANTKATDPDNMSAPILLENRINGQGSVYIKINDAVNDRVLRALR